MTEKIPLLSICIPAYNRPIELMRLLQSVDCRPSDVEIVIQEDCSQARNAICAQVAAFRAASIYDVKYAENEENLGFDGNLRELVSRARGEFVMFMGDDDSFVPRALDDFLEFLRCNSHAKYVLRSFLVAHPNGQFERFRYLDRTTEFGSGPETVAWLFKRSVVICGFTVSREEALRHATKDLDGTLLYQVYLMCCVCLMHPSTYYDIPFVQCGIPANRDSQNFGAAIAERGRYTPGTITEDNSINFTKAYFEVTRYIDERHGSRITNLVAISLSKYSYPFLSIQRRQGVSRFLKYARRLEIECGFGSTFYFFVYKWALVVLGERNCDRIIRAIKRRLAHTPNL